MNLPSVREVCQPREDILSGGTSLDLYAAKLSQVARHEGPDVYRDPAKFFENTYPTEGLKTTLREVFSRITGKGSGSPVIKLETSLGGGKTHTLIALYHLAKHGSKAAPPRVIGDLEFAPMRVAAIVGNELGTTAKKGEPATLWGELARQLNKYELLQAADEARTSPGEGALRKLFGSEKTLVLIDETALYLVKASGVQIGDSTLARQTVVFLQELTEVAASLDNVSLVITSLNKQTVFADQTEELEKILEKDVAQSKAAKAVQEADEVLSRMVRNLTPTRSEEFANVVRFRLFGSNINRTAAVAVCQAYHTSLRSDGVREFVPKNATDAPYLDYLKDTYPFHPELIQILRTKTSSITQFNQTRGVLRLLSLVVKHIWDKQIDTPMIHPHHVDLRIATFREELIARLDRNEYMAAVTADIADTKGSPRSSLVDEEFSNPLGTWIATTAFLHSLTGVMGGDIRKGANESEIQLAIHHPGLDPKAVERALGSLEDRCFYLVKQGSMYAFNTEPNLNKVIERAKDQVEGTQVLREIEDRVQQVFGGRKFFDPRVFANEPSKVPDDTEKPKLVVIHFNEATISGSSTKVPELVDRIYHETGTQGKPRIFSNNLVFLLVDKDEREKMEVKAREYRALKKLWEDIEENAPSVSDLSPAQRSKIKDKRNEAELFVKVAVVVAHKHLFVPTTQKDLDSAQGRKPLRKLSIRVSDAEIEQRQKAGRSEEEWLVTYLRNQKAARTVDDEPLSPDFVLDRLWPKNTASLTGDEFKKIFYKNAAADLMFSPELILKAQQAGVREGRWFGTLAHTFYDKTNASTFSGAFSPELVVVLADTEDGRTAWLQYNCPNCKKRRTQCICAKPAAGPDDEKWRKDQEEKEKERQKGGKRIVIPDWKILPGIIGELMPQLQDQDVERVEMLELKAKERGDLAKLALALPQFLGAEIRFNVQAVINREWEMGGKGNFMKLEYRGDAKGFQEIKQVLLNYDAKQNFSDANLRVQFRWEGGLSIADLKALLGEKVAQFTGEALFQAEVTPAKEAKA